MGWFIAVGLLALAGGSFYGGYKYGARLNSYLLSKIRIVKGAF